jgi:protein gp37
LQQVSAPVKGLSVEPVLQQFDPESLDLNGIDWVILGGESGKFDLVSPFDLGWLRQMIASCRRRGVAVFVKQLGRKPVLNGEVLRLRDTHGGDWDEWPEDLRVREFPRYFHDYRRHN